MTKSELIIAVAQDHPYLNPDDVERAVRAVFDQMTRSLARGDRVEIRGMMAFSVRHRKARGGRNPQAGAPIDVRAKTALNFRASKDLLDAVNAKHGGKTLVRKPSGSSGSTKSP